MPKPGLERDAGSNPPAPHEAEPRAIPSRPPEPPSADAARRLDEALASPENRDTIAAALLDFCVSRAARSALFAVGREGIRGVAGRGRGFDTEILTQICVSPDVASIFDAALRSRDFFFGAVPPLPSNRDLYTVLGGRLPAMALVLPIRVKGRTAALLYLDDDDRPMRRPDIPLMRRVVAKAGLAFEILLLRTRLRGI
jgi:hypothetical protein